MSETKQVKVKKSPVQRAQENLAKAQGRTKNAVSKERQAERELKDAIRKEEMDHLCNRGRAVNDELKDKDAFSDEEVAELVKLAFSSQEVQERIQARLDEVAQEEADDNDGRSDGSNGKNQG